MAKGDDIQERLIDFAVALIKQECDELCKIISTSIKTTIANKPGNKSKAVKAGITDG